ncbi:RHS repeat domain-containing protein [Sphingomonas hengshuiensis]|uniref:RHS repeat protein n=1 Tax=Sphingomonas hengshuiensis TaxID=1609977 RepID=A0A7U5BE82_9SPHN|nr:RHS repeat domain-containing protein [Sphingomonas hengshuiensis]AJP70588.1 hypothetical protein TS85_00200 [Sphingomonas hengshuiensis]
MKMLIGLCALLTTSEACAQETTTYTYDALGRLVTSKTQDGPNHNTETTIAFDNAGNRTNYQVTGATGSPSNALKVVVVPLNGFTVIPIRNPWAAR